MNFTYLGILIVAGFCGLFLSGVFSRRRGLGFGGNLIMALLGSYAGYEICGLIGLTGYGILGSFLIRLSGATLMAWIARLLRK